MLQPACWKPDAVKYDHSGTRRMLTVHGGSQQFMSNHGFESIEDFRGASLPYFTTHHELVRMQKEAIAAKKAARVGLSGDDKWSGEGFVKEAESMVAN